MSQIQFEVREFNPAKLRDSKTINLDDPLAKEEKHQLLESMREHGQIVDGIAWKGECVDGRNRKRNCRILKIKFRARVYPDNTPEEVIRDIVDQAVFTGRDYTPERRQRKLLLRYVDILKTPDKMWDGAAIGGKLYRNKAVYLSLKTRIPLKTIQRDIRAINARLSRKEKARPWRWLSITQEKVRLARQLRREYQELVLGAKEELRKRIKKEGEAIKKVEIRIREKASEIPGGLTRILKDKSI